MQLEDWLVPFLAPEECTFIYCFVAKSWYNIIKARNLIDTYKIYSFITSVSMLEYAMARCSMFSVTTIRHIFSDSCDEVASKYAHLFPDLAALHYSKLVDRGLIDALYSCYRVTGYVKYSGVSAYAGYGTLKELEWAMNNSKSFDGREMIVFASKCGNMQNLQYLYYMFKSYNFAALRAAVSNKRIEVVKWVIENGIHVDRQNLIECMHIAISGSDFPMVVLLKENFTWNMHRDNYFACRDTKFTKYELSWMQKNDLISINMFAYASACIGHTELITRMVERGYALDMFMNAAIVSGNMNLFRTLLDKDKICDDSAEIAILYDRCEMLQILYDEGHVPHDILGYTYDYISPETLAVMLKNGCEFSGLSYISSVHFRPELLPVLNAHGIVPDNGTIISAIGTRKMQILKLVCANAEKITEEVIKFAEDTGARRMAEFLKTI